MIKCLVLAHRSSIGGSKCIWKVLESISKSLFCVCNRLLLKTFNVVSIIQYRDGIVSTFETSCEMKNYTSNLRTRHTVKYILSNRCAISTYYRTGRKYRKVKCRFSWVRIFRNFNFKYNVFFSFISESNYKGTRTVASFLAHNLTVLFTFLC